ncbi:hypothetical protein [Streptomyces alboflavus]|uniref:hypothetical protein n=1 Tax=Streptomyces alboflavus TaxID=67267 RepID=UPI0036977E28
MAGVNAVGNVGKKATAAVSMAVVLLTAAACGDDAGSSSSKPLSRAQLSRAALAQGDVPGYKISNESRDGGKHPARSMAKSCQPIADAMDPKASAYGKRFAVRRIIKNSKGSQVSMAEYLLVLFSAKSESAAKEAVKDVKKAISACGSGFKTASSGPTSKIRRVVPLKSRTGDAGVEFSVEYQSRMKRRYVVTQKGASMTTIVAQHASWLRYASVPQKIVDAQRQKLEKTAVK